MEGSSREYWQIGGADRQKRTIKRGYHWNRRSGWKAEDRVIAPKGPMTRREREELPSQDRKYQTRICQKKKKEREQKGLLALRTKQES